MSRKAEWIGVFCLVVLGGLSLAVLPGVAKASGSRTMPGAGTNVQLTIKLGEIKSGQQVPLKSYSIVATPGGRGTKFFSGQRLPIPATKFQASTTSAQSVPLTSYVYQNVGFSVELGVNSVQDGRVELSASIEDSAIGTLDTDQPSVVTRDHQITVWLSHGQPLEVARANSSYMTIQADILN